MATAFAIIYFIMTDMYTLNVYQATVDGQVPAFVQAGLQGGIYTGWGLALMMGLLFITLLLSRDNVQGQSFYIAVFMGLGNLGAYLFDITAAARMPTLVHVLVAASLTVNAVYAVMVYRKSREVGVDPWRRW